jgi:H+/Cl- antiporter ClcA
MKAFFSLLASTVAVWTLVFFFTLYVPTITGVHDPGARSTHFLRWIPGIAIAFLSGTAGAFFNGLLEIWRTQTPQPQTPDEQQPVLPPTVHFVVRPLLGAFSGFILFLFFATGGLSLTYQQTDADTSGAPIGALIYQLTPHTASQLATTILLTFVGGYFFPLLPELLDAYRKRMLP